MADPEQRRRILASVDDWNLWRRADPTVVPVLRGVDFSGRDLSGADLSHCSLQEALFRETRLDGVDFSWADLDGAVFLRTDLRRVRGLSRVPVSNRVSLDLETLYRSKGALPRSFLRIAGAAESDLDMLAGMFCSRPNFHSVFLSYAKEDGEFASRLNRRLCAEGIESWFAPRDLPPGGELFVEVPHRIAESDRFLVVLSRHSARSLWVAREVAHALDKPAGVLIPIVLDHLDRDPPPWWRRIVEEAHCISTRDHTFEGLVGALVEVLTIR